MIFTIIYIVIFTSVGKINNISFGFMFFLYTVRKHPHYRFNPTYDPS